MTRKRFTEEAALDLLRQIDLDLASGSALNMKPPVPETALQGGT